MSAKLEATIHDVIQAIRDAREHGDGCVLLIGAGCSKSAGIPNANEIVEDIKKKHKYWYDLAKQKTYSECMNKLSQKLRHHLIKDYVKDAGMNWASIGIAQLLKENYIDRILTTNFDPLIAKACALSGEFPAVYDLASTSEFIAAQISEKSIFYLHGQHTGFFQIHTTEQFEKQYPESIRKVFEETGTKRLWIIVGYSGENDPVFEKLAEFPRFDNRLYWVCYENNEPAPHVRDKLLVSGKDAYYVKGYDSDSFFTTLCHELGCFPPEFVKTPFSFLKDRLDDIVPYTLPGETSGPDVLSETKTRIQKAIKKFEVEPVSVDPGKNNWATLLKIVQNLFLAGDYDKVIKLTPESIKDTTDKLKDAIAWAHFAKGNDFCKKAEVASDANKNGIYQKAIEEYTSALNIKPDFHEALNHWGLALYDMAQTKIGADADRLFEEACDKYKAALHIKPDKYVALNNWGLALKELAKSKSGAEADCLFEESFEKYETTLHIKPDYHEALNNWGTALSDMAKSKIGADSDRLFKSAFEKFKAALVIKPDDHEALNNWGIALDEMAITKTAGDAVRLIEEACDKYKAAFHIKPDDHEVLMNWGNALYAMAKFKTGVDADRLFEEAFDKYKAALHIKPDMHEALYNWGNALSYIAISKTGADADRLFEEAFDKYEAALRIKPDKHNALCNWGNALDEMAKTKAGSEADRLFEVACDKYKAAFHFKPDDHEALNNWGNALSSMAKSKICADAEHLFAEAFDKYKAALHIKPDKHEALNNWGYALLNFSLTKDESLRETIFKEAMDKLQKANVIKPGFGSYNLACIYSLTNKFEECKKWLYDCKKHGEIPSKKHLEEDTDLANVRNEGWFIEFLEELD